MQTINGRDFIPISTATEVKGRFFRSCYVNKTDVFNSEKNVQAIWKFQLICSGRLIYINIRTKCCDPRAFHSLTDERFSKVGPLGLYIPMAPDIQTGSCCPLWEKIVRKHRDKKNLVSRNNSSFNSWLLSARVCKDSETTDTTASTWREDQLLVLKFASHFRVQNASDLISEENINSFRNKIFYFYLSPLSTCMFFHMLFYICNAPALMKVSYSGRDI